MKRSRRTFLTVAVAGAAGLAGGIAWWRHSRRDEHAEHAAHGEALAPRNALGYCVFSMENGIEPV